MQHKHSNTGLHDNVSDCIAKIQSALTPSLLSHAWKEKYLNSGNQLTGHCYVASEALFHLLGGKESGWMSLILNHKSWPEGCSQGETHWFLRHSSGLIANPTQEQFGIKVPHELGRPTGFLTRGPSKRAQIVITRISKFEPDLDLRTARLPSLAPHAPPE